MWKKIYKDYVFAKAYGASSKKARSIVLKNFCRRVKNVLTNREHSVS